MGGIEAKQCVVHALQLIEGGATQGVGAASLVFSVTLVSLLLGGHSHMGTKTNWM